MESPRFLILSLIAILCWAALEQVDTKPDKITLSPADHAVIALRPKHYNIEQIEQRFLLYPKLHDWLIHREFARLHDHFSDLLGNFYLKHQALAELDWAVSATIYELAADKPYYDEFVELYPKSWIPRFLRGIYLLIQAQSARGTQWASDTPESAMLKMQEIGQLAEKDLLTSIDMEPNLLYAYSQLIYLYKITGQEEKLQDIFRRAQAISPYDPSIWLQLQDAALPRWGGSYQQMRRNIRETEDYIPNYPELRFLSSIRINDIAAVAYQKDEDNKALVLYSRAFRDYQSHSALNGRATVFLYHGNLPRALEDINAVLYNDPFSPSSLYQRAHIYMRMHQQFENAQRTPVAPPQLEQYRIQGFKDLERALLMSESSLDNICRNEDFALFGPLNPAEQLKWYQRCLAGSTDSEILANAQRHTDALLTLQSNPELHTTAVEAYLSHAIPTFARFKAGPLYALMRKRDNIPDYVQQLDHSLQPFRHLGSLKSSTKPLLRQLSFGTQCPDSLQPFSLHYRSWLQFENGWAKLDATLCNVPGGYQLETYQLYYD